MSDQEIIVHLAGCYDAAYSALGECAPRMNDDAFVVASYEVARLYGEVTLKLRTFSEEVPVPLALIDAVTRHSFENDPSGAMTLYAVAIVLGPRFLVSLRDAREEVRDERALELLNHASDTTLATIRLVGDTARAREPIEDQVWQEAARDLINMATSSGYAESFGISR